MDTGKKHFHNMIDIASGSYTEVIGGRLRLIAEFPKHKPVVLSGIATLGADATHTPPRAR
jgi:hypothetical protein